MSKILIIGDTHLGLSYPNNSDKWYKVAKEYFEKFLFPLVETELTEKDIIVHCGDFFDNRNVIPIDILNYGLYILERLSKTCPVHIIVGNHDLFTKSTNDINTLNVFKYIPNVNVYVTFKKIEFNNKSILLMPWVEKKSDQIDILKENSGMDYLFCHSDLNGAKMHLSSVAHKNKDKIDVEEFSGFKHVYSAHIHILQESKNFTFVGSIHEMDRNDMNNQKGIFIIDTDTDEERFIPNNISPKFKKVYLMSEEDVNSLDSVSTHDFIDLYISNSLLIGNRKLRRKLEIMLENGNFASVDYIDDIKRLDEADDNEYTKEESSNLDFTHSSIDLEYKQVIRDYILNQKWENENIKEGIVHEFSEISRIYDESYKDKS